MWLLSNGEQVLRGAEAGLFRAALGALVGLVERTNEDLWEFGIAAFDGLQHAQKLALLAYLGRALLHEDEPMPRPTAVLEAAVATVYEHLMESIELEIDSQASPTWRQLVLGACREAGMDEHEDLPDPGSDDLEQWDLLVQCLSDNVLWDADRNTADMFFDAEPEISVIMEGLGGFDQDPYAAIPPDCLGVELDHVRAKLRELTGSTGDPLIRTKNAVELPVARTDPVKELVP